MEHEIFSTCSKWPEGIRTLKMDVEESVRLLLKKQHPVKRQPHSATILKRWRGEESPSVLRRRGCQAYIFPALPKKDSRLTIPVAIVYEKDNGVQLTILNASPSPR